MNTPEAVKHHSEKETLRLVYDDYKRLYDLSTVFYESHNISVVLDRVLDAFGEIVDFSGAALYLLDQRSKKVRLYERRDISPAANQRLKDFERNGYLEWSLENDRIVLMPDEKTGSKESALFVPLVVSAVPLGILVVLVELSEGEITSRLMDQFILLATQGAMAIKNAKLYHDLQQKNRAVSEIRNFLTGILINMADPLIAVEERGKIAVFNPAAEELFQLPANKVLHEEYKKVLPALVVRLLDKAFQLALHGKSFQEDGVLFQKNGRSVPLGFHASAIRSASDTFGGVIVSIRDLSESRELLNLRKIDQLKDEFISSISHELRTPLTVIQSFTEILLDFDGDNPETRKEFLQIIQSQAYRLLAIIDNILTLAEINRGGLMASKSRFAFPKLIQETVDIFRKRLQEKSIHLKQSIEKNLSEVETDRRFLKLVLVNLIDNAIKFTTNDGTIEIGARETSDKELQIFVRDSGVGVPPESTQIIFERFKQLGNTLTDKPDGTGLGLYIAKNLVEKLGGKIWVESQRGSGATFFVLLPLIEEEEPVKDA